MTVFVFFVLSQLSISIVGISIDIYSQHFAWFGQGLKSFPDRYLDHFPEHIKEKDHLPYLCPLCLECGFILSDEGIGLMAEFTLDHFPPSCVGGKLKVLTCKDCNNKAGGEYEAALKERMTQLSVQKRVPGSKLKVKSTMLDVPGRYTGILRVDKGGELEMDFKANPSDKMPPLDEWVAGMSVKPWEAQIVIKDADAEKVRKGLLKAVYLYCFFGWGYEFAFSYSGQKMREALTGTGDFPSTVPFFFIDRDTKANEGAIYPVGLCFVEIAGQRQLAVNLLMENEEGTYRRIECVLVPGPSEEEWNALKSLKMPSNGDVDIKIGGLTALVDEKGFLVSYSECSQKILTVYSPRS
jgi:hypothetical protein